MKDDELVYFGGEVKHLGGGKVGGYLVRYSNNSDTDLDGEFFTADTDFGVADGNQLPVYYNHGMDSAMKNRRIGRGAVKYDDAGLWFEAQLEMRDNYERRIVQLAEAGKLGWSSGAAGHLVERVADGDASKITSWPLAEASLTPTPAEPRNSAVPIKSLQASSIGEADENTQEKNEMDESKLNELLDGAVVRLTAAFDDKVKALSNSMPEIKSGYHVEVVKDEADKAVGENAFKSAGEFFSAVKHSAYHPYATDKRLVAMKAAAGANEGVPADGGYLVPKDIASDIYKAMFPQGNLLSFFKPLPVTGNSLTINAVDESSRKDGYRLGGVRGYWLAEADNKTSSKPKFRQIDLKLKKVAALCYATDELLDDVAYMAAWITREVPNELRFLVENSFVNGSGSGQPLGILNSGALVTVNRAASGKIAANDVFGLWSRRLVGQNDYVWMTHQSAAPQLYDMAIGNAPAYLPAGGLSAAPYATLLGRPIIETEYNPALGATGDLMLVSPSAYAAIDKGGAIDVAQSIHVEFVTDQTAFRFVYRVDGAPLLDSPITPFSGSDDQSAFVALDAST